MPPVKAKGSSRKSFVPSSTRRSSVKVVQALKRPVPIARATGELAGLLSATYPKVYLGDVVLPEATLSQLKRVVEEYHHQDKLRATDFPPAASYSSSALRARGRR